MCGGFASQVFEALLGELGILEPPGAADPGEDLGTVALGEQVADVAFLVAMAPMHERVLAEHVPGSPGQGFAAVDYEQDRLLGIQTPLDQV